MKLSSFYIPASFAVVTLAAWALLNRPVAEPPLPSRIQGFAFSPYRDGQDAVRGDMPSESEIDSDLALLSGKTNSIRTYSTLGTLGQIPRLAAKRRINVALGAWIGADYGRNEQELSEAIALAGENKNVVRAIIGNEVVLRGDIPLAEVTAYLDRARDAIAQPVSTAEPWHVWLKHPELAEHVDFIAVHMLPYWEGVEVERAVGYTLERIQELEKAFPGKPIVIGEVGWPSNGRTRDSAVASESNEALFLRRFISQAERRQYVYYVMEAFDQPWKGKTEGAVGAYWGVYDVNRLPKFAFKDPIVRVPEWQTLAAISVGAALILLTLLYVNSQRLRARGRSFLALVVFPTATITVWVIHDFTRQYLTVTSVAVGTLLFVGMLGVILVLLTEAHEWAEAHWVRPRRRFVPPPQPPQPGSAVQPKVSIHVPAYNEPSDMLIETLDALARLNYSNFEVLVIDNNTRDEAVWRPVEAHCARLGERFRFFHVNPLPGFKAGALNYALRHTAADAKIVAVIDSDYVVEPNWLHDLVPVFGDPNTVIVQAPQDYRDQEQNAFKAMCYAEYRGFFKIGMITRNERNAIIQHGTMTLVRRQPLQQNEGWAEWCITEDAELGLRMFKEGYEANYIAQSYGRGLMPDTFIDFKKQRFRWTYGAMQILKAHAAALFSRRTPLTNGQQYHFVAGWLPWIADGFNLLFNLAALGWSLAMILMPGKIDPPLMTFSVLPLSLFAFKIAKLVHLYRVRVGANVRQTIAAAIAGLALAHTIGIAVLKGLVTNSEPFFRTPKQARSHAVWRAVCAACYETVLMAALLLAAVGVAAIPSTIGADRMAMGGPDQMAWIVVLCIQAIPYASALIVSLMSAIPLPARLLGTAYRALDTAMDTAEVAPPQNDPATDQA